MPPVSLCPKPWCTLDAFCCWNNLGYNQDFYSCLIIYYIHFSYFRMTFISMRWKRVHERETADFKFAYWQVLKRANHNPGEENKHSQTRSAPCTLFCQDRQEVKFLNSHVLDINSCLFPPQQVVWGRQTRCKCVHVTWLNFDRTCK